MYELRKSEWMNRSSAISIPDKAKVRNNSNKCGQIDLT